MAASANLDVVRKGGQPLNDQLPIKEGNEVVQVMNNLDDLTRATMGPEERAAATARATKRRDWD